METGVWAFYYVQGEEGEDSVHPNAFRLAGVLPGADVTLADVLQSFPLRNPWAFHFRFRLNQGLNNGFYWLDVVQPKQQVPLASGRVVCKLLRLDRRPKAGLVFKRRPVLKWVDSSRPYNDQDTRTSAGRDKSSRNVMPADRGPSLVDSSSNSSSFHRSSSLPAFEQGRPAKYLDRPLSSTATGADARHSNVSSRSSSISGEKKTVARPGAALNATVPGQEKLEDFLSGGQQVTGNSGAAAATTVTSAGIAVAAAAAVVVPNEDVNLMSDSGWHDAPATCNATSDFLNAMDPLAARVAPPTQASHPGAVYREPLHFDDDNGQTVGPVTMAEMEAHSKSTSDGSNVYNPSLVDKSTKSDDVRRAMEERERQVQRDVERAREDLRKREEAVHTMSAMKDTANAVIGPRLKSWAEDNGRVKNIRTLLSTMHQVMWEDCKWSEVNMGKLIQPNDVKRYYRKAMIVVHPDKAGGRQAEQLLIAERVFAALNTAWEDFQKSNPC
uniref:J domain-containing protein n=1 Tax=Hyaloperonospora arabidopsidis (strain Emoy2) TaxID=559515 RepID=M4BBJ6_HYAAE